MQTQEEKKANFTPKGPSREFKVYLETFIVKGKKYKHFNTFSLIRDLQIYLVKEIDNCKKKKG